MVAYFSFGFLFVLFSLQFLKEKKFKKFPLDKTARWIFFLAVFLVFLYWVFLTYKQYVLWRDLGPPSLYLVPPYKTPLYVMGYHFMRFFLYYLIALGGALFFLLSTKLLNRKFGYRFFESEEPYLGAVSIFALGNPYWNYAWIWYVGILLGLALFVLIYKQIFKKEKERFSLKFLWLPLAFSVIIINVAV